MNELFKLGSINEETMASHQGTYCEIGAGDTATLDSVENSGSDCHG